MGIHIVTGDFFKVGDVICYGSIEGQVVSYNIRTTKWRAARTLLQEGLDEAGATIPYSQMDVHTYRADRAQPTAGETDGTE